MAALLRTRCGDFSLDEALTLARIKEVADDGRIGTVLRGVDWPFLRLRRLVLGEEQIRLVKNGNRLDRGQAAADAEAGEELRVYGTDGVFYGIYRREGEALVPIKMLFTHENN